MALLALSAAFEYLCYESTAIRNTSDSDVFNPLTAKLFILNFHPLEAISRWRDPQLQVSDKMEVNSLQILLIDVTFYLWHV